MKPIAVIGVGSPFGADQLGWHVVKRIATSEVVNSHLDLIDLIQSDRPGASLIEQIKGRETVFLLDAMISDGAVGHVKKWDLAAFQSTDALLSSHGFGLKEALLLAEALQELPPRIKVFAIEVPQDMVFDERVDLGVRRLIVTLEQELKGLLVT